MLPCYKTDPDRSQPRFSSEIADRTRRRKAPRACPRGHPTRGRFSDSANVRRTLRLARDSRSRRTPQPASRHEGGSFPFPEDLPACMRPVFTDRAPRVTLSGSKIRPPCHRTISVRSACPARSPRSLARWPAIPAVPAQHSDLGVTHGCLVQQRDDVPHVPQPALWS